MADSLQPTRWALFYHLIVDVILSPSLHVDPNEPRLHATLLEGNNRNKKRLKKENEESNGISFGTRVRRFDYCGTSPSFSLVKLLSSSHLIVGARLVSLVFADHFVHV